MSNPSAGPVPRTPEEPTPEQVLLAMTTCEPYTASELVEAVDVETSRWTIQRRLDSLHEKGQVERKEHADNRVSWWIPRS